MAEKKFLTAPLATNKMPSGIPFIIGNEFAERFSFYGMKAILFTFMTKHLLNAGQPDFMSKEQATASVAWFIAAAYFMTIFGAIIADVFWGRYKTIIRLSLLYCAGHFVLGMDPFENQRYTLLLGLVLIAIGAGGIKPCVSVNVGDQFGSQNQHLLTRVYNWFYFSINVGAALATLLIARLLKYYGPNVAFGVPGLLMAIATIIFWLGRYKYVHVRPSGAALMRELRQPAVIRSVLGLMGIYLFVGMFWSLFDQTSSRWIDQATHMDRTWLGIEWLSEEVQAANPFLILVLIPVFSYLIYPAINRVFALTPLRKVAIGFFVAAAAFAISAMIEASIERGSTPSIVWQLLAYVLITGAEVMVSITCLEFSYTQAPPSLKSIIMSLNLLSVTYGNLFTGAVNVFIQNPDGSSKLEGAAYYWFFVAAMLAAAVGFVFYAMNYRGRSYLQDEAPGSA